MSEITPSQWAGIQGKSFEDAVHTVLRCAGWTIIADHFKVRKAEIDIVAADPDGQVWWIECKGSWRGKTPGLLRGDTVKKAVGVAFYLSTLEDRQPYMLITSHLPSRGSLGDRMIKAALAAGLFQKVHEIAMGVSLNDGGI